MSTQLLDDFKKQLHEFCNARDITIDTWNKAQPISRNIIMIKTHPVPILLYVKVRNERPGFWGLTANQIAKLIDSGIIWYVILLLESLDTGYILSSVEVERHINNADWILSRDGDYKLNEGLEVDSKYGFYSFEDLMNRIFGY